ncbi:NADPH:quinone reductase [Pseudoalteromonas sp. A25]|uniref:NAD(P)-dependent alcohol dehydrogenase n=1 Tax=Pseudoalteromonas sp. A25 TaxID=116092 RepID=UPI001260E236|nr:NAD(P)-dependent alcohol dehydrogenase [Pseudoalteromonas sp. A25]BBN82501.1 NADPH:quinone reductase [Pseudoalteromonas sp. A25]
MKAVYQSTFGGNEVIQIGQCQRPKLKASEVLIENRAASINPRDWLIRDGKYQLPWSVPRLPFILGSDFAGVVVAKGEHVRRFQVGDRVYGMKDPSHGLGAFAEFVAVKEQYIAKMPDTITFEQGAATPLCALTAWQSLSELARVRPNEKVLVIGGSGGLGSFAIQIAVAFGAHVTAVCSKKNEAICQSLGAKQTIAYDEGALEECSQTFDVVLNTVAIYSVSTLKRFLARKGRFVNAIPEAKTFLYSAVSYLGAKLGISKRRYFCVIVSASSRRLNHITTLIEQAKLVPKIDRVYPLTQIREALSRSRSFRAVGKIVLTIDPATEQI